MANIYKCSQCSETFDKGIKRFWHEKKAHGVVNAPSIIEVGMKQVVLPDATKESAMPLPPPIEAYAKIVFGEWLDHIKVENIWKEDCGGYAINIKVPQHMSTQYKKIPKYPIKRDEDGELDADGKLDYTKPEYIDIPDERTFALNGRTMEDVKQWLDLVKKNILENAQKKGIQLPNIVQYNSAPVPSMPAPRMGPQNTFTHPNAEMPTLA